MSIAWETFRQIMEKLRPKMINPLNVFILILLILCRPNASIKSYRGTGKDRLSAQHKGGMVSVSWENIVSAYGSATV